MEYLSVIDVLEDIPLWNALDLCGAHLSNTDLSSADLRGANLRGADLYGADLSSAYLRGADLSSADLRGANLRGADLCSADLSSADLCSADLCSADLSGADLSGADLCSAHLSGANLSSTKGILDAEDWLDQHFEEDSFGYIVYRAQYGCYTSRVPKDWEFKSGAILTEVPNPNRTEECGCGVSFATREWVKETYPTADILWKCRIRYKWLSGVVVPYNTDGKARCSKLELLETVA